MVANKKSSERKGNSVNRNMIIGVVVLVVLLLVIVNFGTYDSESGLGVVNPLSGQLGSSSVFVNDDSSLIAYYDFEEENTRIGRFSNVFNWGRPKMQRWRGSIDFVDSFSENYGRGIQLHQVGGRVKDILRISNFHLRRNPIVEELSVSFWVKTNISTPMTLFKKKSAASRRNGQKGFQLDLNSNKTRWLAGGLVSGASWLDCSYNFSGWTHVVVTARTFGNKTIYVNGEECARGLAGVYGMNARENWFWGANRGFTGSIDEVKIWNRELDEDEVMGIYGEYVGFDQEFCLVIDESNQENFLGLQLGESYWKSIGSLPVNSRSDCYRGDGVDIIGDPLNVCCPLGYSCNVNTGVCEFEEEPTGCSDFTNKSSCGEDGGHPELAANESDLIVGGDFPGGGSNSSVSNVTGKGDNNLSNGGSGSNFTGNGSASGNSSNNSS